MDRLEPAAQALIALHCIGHVATINVDDAPAVSPKRTCLRDDNIMLSFSHSQSPATVAILQRNPRVGNAFTDTSQNACLNQMIDPAVALRILPVMALERA